MLVVKWFILLMVYSFIGWIYESIVVSVEERRLVNRGFLNGPICPVYGFGGLIIISLLYNKVENTFVLFLICMVITTTLEYITAIILEKVFDARWWDYSNYPLNFQGRICLLGAVVFGILGVLALRHWHPFLLNLLEIIPPWVLVVIFCIWFLAFVVDMVVTIRHLFRLNNRLQEIQGVVNSFLEQYAKRAEELKASAFERLEESEFYTERIRKLFNSQRFQDIRIALAFPKLRPFHNNEAWQWLKSKLIKKNKP